MFFPTFAEAAPCGPYAWSVLVRRGRYVRTFVIPATEPTPDPAELEAEADEEDEDPTAGFIYCLDR